jgi:hypothetical protein
VKLSWRLEENAWVFEENAAFRESAALRFIGERHTPVDDRIGFRNERINMRCC